MVITEDMVIMDVLQLYPATREVFIRHSMSCAGCFGANDESIADGAAMHGIELAALLAELNAVVTN